MTQLERAKRTLNLLTETGADLADTALKLGETAVAAGTVIGARMALGAQAIQDPVRADADEFTRMSTEKIDAFTASSNAVLGEMQQIGRSVVRYVASQTADAARAAWDVSTAANPFHALEAQRRWLLESWARTNNQAIRLASRSIGITSTALAPVHSTATDNARRLVGLPPRPHP